ncbi:MAG: L-serine ammonia-lyase, iron-sulfur-dependent, subunit alpha [Verrucomicrobiota bacterium]
MRGPSSSHSAAALRIGRLARFLMNENLREVDVFYDPNGSLVTTHKSQGSDMGLCGGLLGWEADDPRLLDYESELAAAGITLTTNYESYGTTHPNMYFLKMRGESGDEHTLTAVSLGGGMIEVWKLDETVVKLSGGSYVLFDAASGDVIAESATSIDESLIFAAADGRLLQPVLPVLDGSDDVELPFTTCAKMQKLGQKRSMNLAELATAYESARSGMDEAEVRGQIRRVLNVMRDAVDNGLKGTSYEDRILPSQIGGFREERERGRMIGGDPMKDVIEAVTAALETKSAMGPIVAAPTAGSSGVVPGTLLGVAHGLDVDEDQLIDALLVAGVIGMFIARGATFSAEEGGCMAECGSASSMVAAALVHLRGGSTNEAVVAATLALQNSFGMICDPIGNRVEAPCLGKNTMAAMNAMSSVNMALAGYQHLVPFDEVVDAMNEVGQAIPRELCCTGLGGLATTPTAQLIEKKMNGSCATCPSQNQA